MKLDRVIWGILLLFIGGVLLLDNFGIINFYWRNVWDFWPVFLIIIGVNILFNRNNSQLGNILSIGILLVTLTFLFFRGQSHQRPIFGWYWSKNHDINIDIDSAEWDEGGDYYHYATPMLASDSAKRNVLVLKGGASAYKLMGETDSLFSADGTQNRGMKYMFRKDEADTINNMFFTMKGSSKGFHFDGNSSSHVNFYLNKHPKWDIRLTMGAGDVDFDLSGFRVTSFSFDGGASDVDVKLGDLEPLTYVTMKVGMADINVDVPASSGCRIKTKTGLSSKSFEGFTKMPDGTYETPNFKNAAKKVFITLDGGLSDFEVKRY